MADVTFTIRSEDEYSAELKNLQRQLEQIDALIKKLNDDARRFNMGDVFPEGVNPTLKPLVNEAEELRGKMRQLQQAYVEFMKSGGKNEAAAQRLYDMGRELAIAQELGNYYDKLARNEATDFAATTRKNKIADMDRLLYLATERANFFDRLERKEISSEAAAKAKERLYDMQRQIQLASEISNKRDADAKKSAAETKSNRVADLERELHIQTEISAFWDKDAKQQALKLAAEDKLLAMQTRRNREYDLENRLQTAFKTDPARQYESRIAFGPQLGPAKAELEAIGNELNKISNAASVAERGIGTAFGAGSLASMGALQGRLRAVTREMEENQNRLDAIGRGFQTAFGPGTAVPRREIESLGREFQNLQSQAARAGHGVEIAFAGAFASPAMLAGIRRSMQGFVTETIAGGQQVSSRVRQAFTEIEEHGGRAFSRVGLAARHLVAIFDEFFRGQRGAMVSSLAAMARDSGLAEAAIAGMTVTTVAAGAAILALAAAIAFMAEQAYQRFRSIREATEALQLKGLGEQATELTTEFDELKSKYNEYAGTIRELQTELNKLPGSAQSSRRGIAELAESLARIKGETPAKAIEEIVKAIEKGPEAFAKLIEEMYGLSGQLLINGQTLSDFAKHSTNAEKAIQAMVAVLLNLDLTKLAQEGRTASNSVFSLGLEVTTLAEGALIAGGAIDQFNTALEKTIHLGETARTRLPQEFIEMQQNIDKAGETLKKRETIQKEIDRLQGRVTSATKGLEGEESPGVIKQLEKDVSDAKHAIEVLKIELQGLADPVVKHRKEIADVESAQAMKDAEKSLQAQRVQAVKDLERAKQYPSAETPDEIAVKRAEKVITDIDDKIARNKVQQQVRAQQEIAAGDRRGAEERLAAQDQIIKLMTEAKNAAGLPVYSQDEIDQAKVARARMALQLEQERFHTVQNNAREEVELHKSSAAAINEIYRKLWAEALSTHQLPDVMAAISREWIRSLKSAQSENFTTMTEFNSSAERLDKLKIEGEKARLQIQVNSHAMSKETMANKESEFTQKLMAEEEARIEAELAKDGLTDQQKERLYNHLAELYEKDAEQQIQAQERVSAAVEKENDKRSKIFKDTFDKIGEGAEKALTGLLSGEKDQNMLQNLRKSLTSGIVSGAFSLGSEFLGGKLAPLLGVKTEGMTDTSVGNVLGRAVSNLLGLTKKTPEEAAKAASDKLQKAADAQEKAMALVKPAMDSLGEAAKALKEAAEILKGGVDPTGGKTPPAGGTGGGSAGGSSANMSEGELAKIERLRQVASVVLPPGYTTQVSNAFRPDSYVGGDPSKPSEHGFHRAADIKILDPSGNVVPGYMGSGGPLYSRFEAAMAEARNRIYPGENIGLGSTFGKKDAGHISMGGPEAARNEPKHSQLPALTEEQLQKVADAAAKAAKNLDTIPGAKGPAAGAPAPAAEPTKAYAGGGIIGVGGPPTGSSDNTLLWGTTGERILSLKETAKYHSLFPRGIMAAQEGALIGDGYVKQDISGAFKSWDVPQPMSWMDIGKAAIGWDYLKGGYEAAQRGETTQAIGKAGVGLATAAGNLTLGGKAYLGAIGMTAREAPAAFSALMADESGILTGIWAKGADLKARREAANIMLLAPGNKGLANSVWKDFNWGNIFSPTRGPPGAIAGWKSEISDENAFFIRSQDEIKWLLANKSGTLGDIYEHSKLFSAYPDVAKMRLAATTDPKDYGAYNWKSNQLFLSRGIVGTPDLDETVLHEASHFIQRHETWPGGAAPEWFQSQSWRLRQSMADVVLKGAELQAVGPMAQRMAALGRTDSLEGFFRRGSSVLTPDEMKIAADLVKDPHINAWYQAIREYDKVSGEPYAQYQSVAGEVEARLSGQRRLMTAQERRDNPPWGPKSRGGFDTLLSEQIWPPGYAGGGIAANMPGLTSLTTESRGFAPYTLVQTNPGLGKGWGLLLGILGAVGLAAGAAALFGGDDKDKSLADKLLKEKDSNATDVKQTTTSLTQDQLDKIDFSKIQDNPYTGSPISDTDAASVPWWKKILPKFHSGGFVPRDMAAMLQGGELVLPRGFADGGVVGDSTPGSATYSPPSGGSSTTGMAIKQMSESVTNVSGKLGQFETTTEEAMHAIAGMGRTAAVVQTPIQKLTSGLSTIGGAFSGLQSIIKGIGSLGGGSGSSGDSGGGIFGTIGGVIGGVAKIAGLFALEQGGIIPSAQGGMIAGGLGRGGTLAVLHPNEMVLPSHISQAMQDMAQTGGAGAGAPDVHFHLHTIDQRTGAQFLMSHRDTIAGLYRQSYRNFSPNVPSY